MQLKVFLLGRVAVETDGLVIDDACFPGRQGRLLFAYLVAEQGRPVPRDELAEALWGESPPATWEKALTVLVSKVRGLLADLGLDGVTALTAAFGCYRLELPRGSSVDVMVAANAAQKAEEALAAGDLGQAKRAASLAASLVRQPFLPGEEGAWVEEKRRDLAEIRGRALTALADACLRSGDASEAVNWAEQAIVLAPFRETGYRRLMEAHTVAGNRAEALRVYEQCRRLLADELGAYPSPETESIYRGLLEAPPARDGATSALRASGLNAAPGATAERESKSRVAGVASRKRVAVVTLTVAVTAAAVTGILATRSAGESQATAVPANSIVALDPSGSIAAAVPVGARPVAIASGAGALWGREPRRPERDQGRGVVATSRASHPDRGLADGARRHGDRRLGDRRHRRRGQDRPEVRPSCPYTAAACLRWVLRRNGTADARSVRVDLDRQPGRCRLANRPRFRAGGDIRPRRKRSVRDRSRRRLRLGDEQLRRHRHAHRPGDARGDHDPRRPRPRRSRRQRCGRVDRQCRRRHARARRHQDERHPRLRAACSRQ